MSKADSIQKKIWKAYGKVGKTLGQLYDVYRAPSTNYPIIPENWITTKSVAFSQDARFSRPLDDGIPMWDTWIDGNMNNIFDASLKPGDYLRNEDEDRTYVIASMQSFTTIRTIMVPNRITVYGNETYVDGVDGLAQEIPVIAQELPCNIMQSSSANSNGYLI